MKVNVWLVPCIKNAWIDYLTTVTRFWQSPKLYSLRHDHTKTEVHLTLPTIILKSPGSWWWMAATSLLAFRPVEVRLVANVDLSLVRSFPRLETWKYWEPFGSYKSRQSKGEPPVYPPFRKKAFFRDSEAHHHPPIRRYQGRDFLRDKMPTEIFRKELPEGILWSKKLEDTKRKELHELHSVVQGHPKMTVVFLPHQLSGASFVSGKVIVVNSPPILPSTWQMSCKYLLSLKSWTCWKRRSKHHTQKIILRSPLVEKN